MISELRVIGLMFIVLLLAACSKNEDSPEETQPVINVYVYSPDHPTITRGDIGNVDPIDNTLNESLINSLQIWVFEHNTNTLVSYYKPETVRTLNAEKGVTYQLNVSEAFAKAKPKPNVDVYVVANAASCELTKLTDYNPEATDEDTKNFRTILEGTLIEGDHFGLTTPLTDKVPVDANDNPIGLPMSGVLRDVAVTGSAPVFKISSVKLTRAVSKLRFIFSKDNVDTPVKITGIKLGVELGENNVETMTSQIPTEEYLFLKADNSLYHIGDSYVTPAEGGTELLLADSPLRNDISKNNDPLKYTYQPGQNAQDYENLIAEGLKTVYNENNEKVRDPELSEVGPYYLRETDKKLCGVITYKKGTSDEVFKAPFEMKTAGDFSRNHTWIVYAYYGVDGMQVITVYSQEWHEMSTTQPHNVYNW